MSGEGARPTKNAPAPITDTSSVRRDSDVLRQAEAILDYWNAQLTVIKRMPDDVLVDIAFLACHDDIVTAAYRELERRRSA